MGGSGASAALRAEGLSKQFGSVTALAGVDLDVASGESVALFGPNGAGKTTLIRILSLTLVPARGTFSVAGLDPSSDDLKIRQTIGVISHQSFLYGDLTAAQNLEFFAALYGVPHPRARASELLEMVELTRRADDAVRTLSHGLRQRVSLARALVHDPPIVFLDEPFNGLDPHAAGMLRMTLSRLRSEGRTVVLVTHNLTQGLELSDRWFILSRGRIVDQGRSAETDRTTFEPSFLDRLARSRGARGRS